jgi:hypothetical protein
MTAHPPRTSFGRAWLFALLAADAIWLAALAGRQFGLGSFSYSAAELVNASWNRLIGRVAVGRRGRVLA